MKLHNPVLDTHSRSSAGLSSVVFRDELPQIHSNRPVIDGDEHDYRPADPEGVIVGLKVKGKSGKGDETGFVKTESVALLDAA